MAGGYVSPTTAVTGVLSSTLLNSYKNGLDTFANPARAAMYQSATTTSMTTSVWTPIAFSDAGGIVADTQSGHSTSTNPSRYVVQAGWAGVYSCTGLVAFSTNATGTRQASFGVNGIVPYNGSVGVITPNGATTIGVAPVTVDILLNVGDYVQLLGIQTSGGALATTISLPIASYFQVRWVSVA